MDLQVNYPKPKFYKTSKHPMRQGAFWTWLIRVLSKMMTLNVEHKVEKINMGGLKPPT